MMIGLPGAGKSYEAQKSLATSPNTILLSSDTIRKGLYGNESIQDDPTRVFDLMLNRARKALLNGQNVIYDATNIVRKKRIHTLRQLPTCKKIARVVWAKLETCISNDANRERNVGQAVIEKIIKRFQYPYYDEGFDSIKVIVKDNLYTDANYLDWMDCSHDNPNHAYNSVLQHTTKVCEAIKSKRTSNKSTLLLLGKYHDIGKKFTKTFINSKGIKTEIAHFYDHQNVGSYMALGCEELSKLPLKERLLIAWLVNNHMEPFPFSNSKYYRTLPAELKNLVDTFHLYDVEEA